MTKILLTHIQLFGIGFSFGIMGPCLLVCAPVLITYIAGTKRKFGQAFSDILLFLSGRLIAYLVLGFLAGLSAFLLRQFISSDITALFRPIAGAISIILAVYVLVYKEHARCDGMRAGDRYKMAGVLGLGFVMGIAPCGPLTALLFEIVLISNNAFDGALYALSFGMGTFLSGMIVIGAISGILAWLPARFLKSGRSVLIFKIVCAVFLIIFGLGLIL